MPPIRVWSFTATDAATGATSTATLQDRQQQSHEMLPGVPAERTRPTGSVDAPLLGEIAGSGPWFWAGSGPLSFMRGGVLITPWGTGVWGVSRGADEHAPADTVFADFANSQHNVRMHNAPCIRMASRRKADGDVVGIQFAANGVTPAGQCPRQGTRP